MRNSSGSLAMFAAIRCASWCIIGHGPQHWIRSSLGTWDWRRRHRRWMPWTKRWRGKLKLTRKFFPLMFRTLCWSELGAPNRTSPCFTVLISRPSAVCGISVLAQHFWQLRNIRRKAKPAKGDHNDELQQRITHRPVLLRQYPKP